METISKPQRYFPKPGRGPAGKKVEQTSVKPVPAVNNGQNAESGTLSSPVIETQTQIANRLFRERAAKIADATTTVRPGENEWEPIYRIEVPQLRSEAFDKVVKLRGSLYRKYPNAIINVEFRPRRELDEAENNPRFADV